MAQEIERKFLVDDTHPELRRILAGKGRDIRQGYLAGLESGVVRISATAPGGAISIDGPGPSLNCAIPLGEAREIIMSLCGPGEGVNTRFATLREGVARIRIQDAEAFLTIKGKTTGISRSEFEYPIHYADALALLTARCGAVLHKRRFIHLLGGGLKVEIDVFSQFDLILAEIELPSEDAAFSAPEWLGQEVSQDPSYYNSALAARLTTH